MLTNITTVVVIAIATLMILNEFGVNISPALTGAGIVGRGARLRRADAGHAT